MSVALAYSAGAPRLAPVEYRAAEDALKDGEDLVRRGEFDLAREVLPIAEFKARLARFKAQEEDANLEMQKIFREKSQETTELTQRPPTKSTKKAIASIPSNISKPKPPSPPPPPAPPPQPAKYKVNDGETLWTIAARKEIYFDSLLWPLIYKANRDQIKDPRQIYPGQVLNIPRDTSETEKEEARGKARKSDIFPVQLLMKTNPAEGQ